MSLSNTMRRELVRLGDFPDAYFSPTNKTILALESRGLVTSKEIKHTRSIYSETRHYLTAAGRRAYFEIRGYEPIAKGNNP